MAHPKGSAGGGGRSAGGKASGGISAADFTAASQRARARAERIDQRVQSNFNRTNVISRSAHRSDAPKRVGPKRYLQVLKAEQGYGTAVAARNQRSGRITSDDMSRGNDYRSENALGGHMRARADRVTPQPLRDAIRRRYQAPRTRLY